MANKNIHIDPCPYKWKEIQDPKDSNYCLLCKKHIPNYTHSSYEKVQSDIEKVECGVFHERHLSEGAKNYHFVNALESKLREYGLSKVSTLVLMGYFFLVSCGTKKPPKHYRGWVQIGPTKIQKEQISDPNQHQIQQNFTQE